MKDQRIDIAVGASKNSVKWKNQKWTWERLSKKLCTERRTSETIKEYQKSAKEDRDAIKDIGGFVGAYLLNGRRKTENVIHKQLITLDLDFAYDGFWDYFQMIYSNAAVLHTTHSHTPENPRYRLIMPLSREVTPDEYIAISRRIAGNLNIDLFDKTTFETNRLMFWPSVATDGQFIAHKQSGSWIEPDDILAQYVDWRDSSSYPTSDAEVDQIKTDADKQQDPATKKGMVGIFCRAYSIQEAIEEFLGDEYELAVDGRYTYLKGSTSSGLVIYDDKFAFSHHGTDPTTGRLTNSFDLVRIHKFGHLDTDNSSGANTKSFAMMVDLCQNEPEIKKLITREKLAEANHDFAEAIDEEDFEVIDEENLEWAEGLEVDGKGNYLSTAKNISLILRNDPEIKKAFKENLFDNKKYVFHDVPWRKIPDPEPLKNVDLSGLRNYIESVYGIASVNKIEDSLNLEIERNQFHPIKKYLNSLEWDGKDRVETLLIDYFGAEDNEYTRQAIRKTLTGAVARVFSPGVKFDLVLVLVGDQGVGKSTFFSTLGSHWFSDSFHTMKGKEAFEQLQGAWIIEMAELSGLRQQQIEVVKHFITKQEDIFRPAFGKMVEVYPRQCVFVATTNTSDFLKDSSGNRRFMPVDVRPKYMTQDVFSDSLKLDVDQIWAEAVKLYHDGEKLYLTGESSRIAKIEQSKHSQVDERTGVISEFLNTFLPDNWVKMDLFERREFLNDPIAPEGNEIREVVCIAEIWCECFGKEKKDMDRYKTREINDIMKSLNGWEAMNSTKRFGFYGTQKYYRRKDI